MIEKQCWGKSEVNGKSFIGERDITKALVFKIVLYNLQSGEPNSANRENLPWIARLTDIRRMTNEYKFMQFYDYYIKLYRRAFNEWQN